MKTETTLAVTESGGDTEISTPSFIDSTPASITPTPIPESVASTTIGADIERETTIDPNLLTDDEIVDITESESLTTTLPSVLFTPVTLLATETSTVMVTEVQNEPTKDSTTKNVDETVLITTDANSVLDTGESIEPELENIVTTEKILDAQTTVKDVFMTNDPLRLSSTEIISTTNDQSFPSVDSVTTTSILGISEPENLSTTNPLLVSTNKTDFTMTEGSAEDTNSPTDTPTSNVILIEDPAITTLNTIISTAPSDDYSNTSTSETDSSMLDDATSTTIPLATSLDETDTITTASSPVASTAEASLSTTVESNSISRERDATTSIIDLIEITTENSITTEAILTDKSSPDSALTTDSATLNTDLTTPSSSVISISTSSIPSSPTLSTESDMVEANEITSEETGLGKFI